MPQFDWDEGSDTLDGYDTESSPEDTAQQPTTASRDIDTSRVLDEVEESSPKFTGTEAEWRLEKAQFYRAVINSRLLSSNHPAAVEVEEELQDWAKNQLETLLGIKAQATVAEVSSPFTEDETAALKALAAKVLNRPAVQSTPAPQAKPAPAVTPVAAKPIPQVRKVNTPAEPEVVKRGRGRPRKNPCRECGKMECEHRTRPPKNEPQPVSVEKWQGMEIKTLPDGTKYVDSNNGKRYRLDLRTVTHRQTGETRQAYVPVELSVVQQGAVPYPSEQEAINLAAAEAAQNTSRVQSSRAMNTILDLAMKAPEKEPYIPTPPERK